MSRFFKIAVLGLLSIIAGNQVDQYNDRHDGTAYFVPLNSPYPQVSFDRAKNEDVPHIGEYRAKETMTYKVVRDLRLNSPVFATVSRRIMRRFPYEGGVGREVIYRYKVEEGVEIRPQDHIAFSHVDLPGGDELPPDEYVLEISVSFMYHGDTKTYGSETQPFRVVK